MRGHRLTFAALALAASVMGLAGIRVIEIGVETRASSVVLPSSPPSSLVVTPCPGCTPLYLPTSERSLYFIDQEPVALAELKRTLRDHPEAFLVIIYDKETKELRRLRVFLPAART